MDDPGTVRPRDADADRESDTEVGDGPDVARPEPIHSPVDQPDVEPDDGYGPL